MSKKKIHQLSRDDHIRYHEQALQPLTHALDLIQYQSTNESAIPAQLDFHILMPYLFPSAGNGSKPILPDIKHWLFEILQSQEDLGLHFYLTGPTFLEFIDQLKHHSETVKDIFTTQIDRLQIDLDPIDEGAFASSQKLRAWLSTLTKTGFHHAVQRPVQELASLIDQGLVQGVGDLPYLPSQSTFERYSGVIKSLYQNQCDHRLMYDREKRSDADSRFHYKIDAANMGISKIMQVEADCNFYMFTRTQFTIRTMQELARSDQALPVLFRLYQLDETHSDRITRLKDTIMYAQENVNRMNQYVTTVSFPQNLCERLLTFYKQIRPRLFPTQPEMSTANEYMGASYEEVRDILSDKKKLRDGMERAIDGFESGAMNIASKLSEVVRLDIWEDFELADDPVYQKLRRDLKF
ncbi:MAG: hypothetical protein NXI29_16200 [bacterium]|nr:hypothetical protein [bacterium]